MIGFAALEDCDAEGELTSDLSDKIRGYLDQVADGLEAAALAGEDPLILKNKNYNMYIHKTTECAVS